MGNYQTELTAQILGEGRNANTILGWMPPVYGEAFVFLWLLRAIGKVLDEMEDWAGSFQDQIFPATASEWALPYWEERYGIAVNPDLDMKTRRAAIAKKQQIRMPLNPYRMEQLIADEAGCSVTIEENTGKNKFTVYFDGYLDPGEQKQLKTKIDQFKPAHLTYELSVADLENTALTTYTGMAASMYERYLVEVQP